jgi:hypothetical protein
MASDPDGVYGERIYELGLGEAVERGILAPFVIDVLEIEDPDYYVGLSEDAMRGRRLALLQAALLEHAATYNIRTTLTFHQQVEEAKAFAENLADTAADLYDTEVSEHAIAGADARPASPIGAEPSDLDDLEPYRHVPPDRVWADWLCGDHPIAHRRDVLRQFANGIDHRGRRVHRAFLASVRILGEGVDIVGERGVEAVCIVGARARWCRSCRTSAAACARTRTAARRSAASSCRSSSPPARTRPTWSPAQATSPSWTSSRAYARTTNRSSNNWPPLR